ncbi:glutathione S-transferase 1 [[Candida] railenensis]|uniref:Glutathione S-transferase 1 n=1 Tax=[Candida] railenensis TaxID=45579 RepID=A0A9P0QUD2_9ASCO|nr:glutathione S-transferase 1 [[Candida] railenensis]
MTDKIILHHLSHSRSERIVWLLEELGIPFEIKVYKRKNGRAPFDCKEVHPLGRFPIVEIYKDGDTSKPSRKLTETGYISSYLVEHYDTEKKLIPDNEEDRELAKFYSYYSEGSVQYLLLALMINGLVVAGMPYGLSYLAGKVTGLINSVYYLGEVKNHFKYLDEQLKAKGTDFFAGDKLSYADIILSFPLYDNTFSNPDKVKTLIGVDVETQYPYLYKWSKRIEANTTRQSVADKVKNKL